jgi:hypothetical protein
VELRKERESVLLKDPLMMLLTENQERIVQMTLCIAVKYPLSYLRNFPVPLDEAIILLSDSRITYFDETSDVIDKIVKICSNVAVSIAGDARFQLETILSIRNRVEIDKVLPVNQVLDIIRDSYRNKISLSVNNPTARTFVSISDHKLNKARLFKITIDIGINVEELNDKGGMYFIGSDEMRQQLTRFSIEDAIRKQNGNGLAFEPMEWANLFHRVFNEQFNYKPLDRTIGGIIQSAFLDKNGLYWGNHAILKSTNNGDMAISERTVRNNNRWERVLENGKSEKTETLVELLKILK